MDSLWSNRAVFGFHGQSANIWRTAESIHKLNTMMRIQSGSLCQSGNRVFTANQAIFSNREIGNMCRNGIQSGNRVFPANRAIGLLQPIGQLFLNRAGCPNRAIATIGNWMPLVQSVPIGSQSGRWSQSCEKTSQ